MFRLFKTAAIAVIMAAISPLSHADETTPVDLPHIDPVTVTYRAFDPEHVLINENMLIASVARVLTDSTKFRMRTGERDTSDAVLDTGGRTTTNTQKHDLLIEYMAITRFLSGGQTGTVLAIPVHYDVTRSDTAVTISYTFKDHVVSFRRGMPFITRKLWSMDEILADYADLAQRLASMDLKLNYVARGELESKYKPEAVLGNLERMLGRPDGRGAPGAQIGASGSVTKDADYVYTDHGARRQVHVSTFPYHDGAKIAYTASLSYTLKSDGTVVGDESSAALHDLLVKVVDD